jgi:hypothetical protein
MGEIADDIIDSILSGEDQYDRYEGPAPICPYCGQPSVRMTQTEWYGREFNGHYMYVCRPCDATVGCHVNGEPMGRLANKKLRALRKACHTVLDKMWVSGKRSRKKVYELLAKNTGVGHIGDTDEEDCMRVLEWAGKITDMQPPESETYLHNGRDYERGGLPTRRPKG